MKRAAILLVFLIVLAGCAYTARNVPDAATSISEASASDITAFESQEQDSEAAASEAAAKAASEAAVSEAAAKAASEAAASEAAAKAASEAAAKAASEAAASEAAAKAASEAAASEAAAKAASEGAASKAVEKTTTVSVTGTNFLSSVEKSILTKINKEREAEGLDALTFDENLRSAARIRSRELYKAGTFEHLRPNGDPWQTVLSEDVPVQYASAGENLCTTQYNDPNNQTAKSASFWVEQWMNSPPHYENIMREEFTHAGVGVYYIEKKGMVYAYATMIFAQL